MDNASLLVFLLSSLESTSKCVFCFMRCDMFLTSGFSVYKCTRSICRFRTLDAIANHSVVDLYHSSLPSQIIAPALEFTRSSSFLQVSISNHTPCLIRSPICHHLQVIPRVTLLQGIPNKLLSLSMPKHLLRHRREGREDS
eukprot:Gb_02498 [translate_table: standard]